MHEVRSTDGARPTPPPLVPGLVPPARQSRLVVPKLVALSSAPSQSTAPVHCRSGADQPHHNSGTSLANSSWSPSRRWRWLDSAVQGTPAVRAWSAALPGSARAPPGRFPLRDWPAHGPLGGPGHRLGRAQATPAPSSSRHARAGAAVLSMLEEGPPFSLDPRNGVGDLGESIM